MENFDWKTLGHQAIKSVLGKQLETGMLPHAYLFKGQEGLGKKSLANEFAKQLLGTTDLFSHPDFVSLGAEEKVSIEEVRNLISKLSVRPFTAKYTVAIIDNAHLLNASASNALLKQLEEPAATSIIILVASGAVLPTIISRCQTFSFNPLSFTDFEAVAKKLKLFPSRESYALSGGSPGRLVILGSEPQFLQELEKRVMSLEELQAGGVSEKIIALKELSELETDDLARLLAAWLYRIKDSLAQNPARFVMLRPIMTALKQLETNMNKKFILQKLFLEN